MLTLSLIRITPYVRTRFEGKHSGLSRALTDRSTGLRLGMMDRNIKRILEIEGYKLTGTAAEKIRIRPSLNYSL